MDKARIMDGRRHWWKNLAIRCMEGYYGSSCHPWKLIPAPDERYPWGKCNNCRRRRYHRALSTNDIGTNSQFSTPFQYFVEEMSLSPCYRPLFSNFTSAKYHPLEPRELQNFQCRPFDARILGVQIAPI